MIITPMMTQYLNAAQHLVGVVLYCLLGMTITAFLLNHIINAVYFCRVKKKVRQILSAEEAGEKINALLEAQTNGCRVSFYEGEAVITNSIKISSRRTRIAVCALFSSTPLSSRSISSLSAEWYFHNLAYKLNIKRKSAKDVNLDYCRDKRWYVNLAVAIFQFLGLV